MAFVQGSWLELAWEGKTQAGWLAYMADAGLNPGGTRAKCVIMLYKIQQMCSLKLTGVWWGML
jgi:hypothetical protein